MNICSTCLRWDNKEKQCRGWLSPNGCNPIYNPAKYKKELEQMISHYRKRASVGATSRLIQDLQPEIDRLNILIQEGLHEAYREDVSRGTGGGKSESDSNSAASIKAKMKDNRILDTKMRASERDEVKEAYAMWEEESGESLEKINSFNIMSRSKIDSYTGEEIPDTIKKRKRTKKSCK